MNAPYEALFGALHGLAPNMPDAACKGQDMHDEHRPGELDATERHAAAITVCNSCTELQKCREWVEGLRPSQRPTGVVAGKLYTTPRIRKRSA